MIKSDRTTLRPKAPLPVVLVVAAILIDNKNRVLLTQRPQGKSLAGLWEFPGGKIHEKENPEDALIRELREELGIKTDSNCLVPLTFASHSYPDFHLLMLLYACRVWRGKPRPLEGQNVAWVKKDEINSYPMPPADEQILPVLFGLI